MSRLLPLQPALTLAVAVALCVLIPPSPAVGGDGPPGPQAQLPDWEALSSGFSDETRLAFEECGPSVALVEPCFAGLSDAALGEAGGAIHQGISLRLADAAVAAALGRAHLGPKGQGGVRRALELARWVSLDAKIAVRQGRVGEAATTIRNLAVFLNAPLRSSAGRPTMIQTMARSAAVGRLVKGLYAELFCKGQPHPDAFKVWRDLSTVAIPRFDPEAALRTEYANLMSTLKQEFEATVAFPADPGTAESIEGELDLVRAETAAAGGLLGKPGVVKVMALGFRSMFAELLELARLPLPEAEAAFLALDERVVKQCRNDLVSEAGRRFLTRFFFGGSDALKRGSITQLMVDMTWDSARCLGQMQVVQYWARLAKDVTESRALVLLGHAHLGVSRSPKLDPGDWLSGFMGDRALRPESFTDGYEELTYRMEACIAPECAGPILVIAAGPDGRFGNSDDFGSSGYCPTARSGVDQ